MGSAADTESHSEFNGDGVIKFCAYCGTKLDKWARFCKSCGKQINVQASEDRITERKIVYEGYIHKCPSCGEVLNSFVTNCPSCGLEIRDVRPVSSVKEFAQKLERIEAQKMPAISEQKSVMKMVFGKDFKEKDEVEEAKRSFEEQKQKEKATLIINYSVPNTKEDITEFMLLATSNIDVKHGIDDVVSKAWISKLDQVYQKAELSMGNSRDIEQIKEIYDNKKKQISNKKLKVVFAWVGGISLWFFLLGLLWNPAATIVIAVVVVFLLILAFVLLKKK